MLGSIRRFVNGFYIREIYTTVKILNANVPSATVTAYSGAFNSEAVFSSVTTWSKFGNPGSCRNPARAKAYTFCATALATKKLSCCVWQAVPQANLRPAKIKFDGKNGPHCKKVE